MKKKRRLKKWIKVVLYIISALLVGGLFYLIISVGSNDINKMYEECDNEKGYTCSYYEARLYSIRGE